LQNISNSGFPKVRLKAEVLDKQGKSLIDIGNDKDMRSGELMMLSSGYGNVKDKKLPGAKVKLSVQSYCPVAAAVVQKTGAEVVAADSDSGWGSSSGDEESVVNSDESQEVEIARYIRTDQDGNLVCAIAYTQEVLPAWPENSTRILGAYWGYAGGGVGYDGGFFQIKDDSEPEVLDFQQADQSDQSEKFTSLMSVVSNLYTGEDGTATLSKDGQELIEGGRTEGDCKVYWDSNFQGEDLGKVSQKWDINWRFEWDDVNAKDSEEKKDKNNRILVEWSIKRAAVNVEEIEDKQTKSAINNVIKLCKKKRFEEAVAVLPEINFEFDSGNMDSSPDDYLAESVDSFIVDPGNPNHSIRVGMDGNKLILTIAVIFEMSLVSGVTADDLDEWLSENGGWAAATAAGQWWYLEDDGGSFATVKSITSVDSKPKEVSCRYCVDLGQYIFPTKVARNKFLKNPNFVFDFQPGNIDDKEGLIKIFGSDNFEPTFENTPPKFIITYLEKNDNNDLGIIISVEVEMSFSLRVEIDEFRDWIESSESTWRYSGRITCVGEDGLESSDREEYEFNW
jgi:hypothetical protein